MLGHHADPHAAASPENGSASLKKLGRDRSRPPVLPGNPQRRRVPGRPPRRSPRAAAGPPHRRPPPPGAWPSPWPSWSRLHPARLVKPDIPSVNGSTPGFTSIPAVPGQVRGRASPANGGSIHRHDPGLVGNPARAAGQQLLPGRQRKARCHLNFQVSDGNTYADKIQTVLASPKDVPDWVVIPSWNLPPRFGQAVTGLFTDLSQYLAGDKVKKYPNLANIPTAAWKLGCFEGGLYGLPYPGRADRERHLLPRGPLQGARPGTAQVGR